MMTCPNCHAGVPDEMRFCLQCGTPVDAAPPPDPPYVAAPEPVMAEASAAPPPQDFEPAPMPPAGEPQKGTTTVPLKIAPTPVMSPRSWATVEPQHGSGEHAAELDDETLKKSFERQVIQPGAIICRFCKGPLDLDGDFCEQCGAPVSEAAPPGMVRPKPQAAVPPPPAPVASAPPPQPAPPAAPPRPPASGAPSELTSSRSAVPSGTVARPNLTRPPAPQVEEQESGLMGRLKGLFKKG